MFIIIIIIITIIIIIIAIIHTHTYKLLDITLSSYYWCVYLLMFTYFSDRVDSGL